MPWISRNSSLTQSEMENNANIVIAYYRSIGVEDRTIASILGNMQAESTINPERYEGGVGPGYRFSSVDSNYKFTKCLYNNGTITIYKW